MKKLLFLSILYLITSCSGDNIDKTEQIKKYYEGFKNSDFNQIKEVISDSLTITEGDYVMNFDLEGYYEQFKWDSIFQPNYKLISVENQNGQFTATVAVESLRFEFLKNNPLTCKHRFSFTSGNIAKIENLDCKDANWQVWQQQLDSLVNWVKQNHPELNGFQHDLSMEGAQNYLRAIKLYQNTKKF
ncbi:hypothetical protein PY092_09720 [Muricauda sp. 334s03]|uniref:SnoaL-like domain-containing protein n=1 Tax=Flagellimonas yonaguniensis TaxID=3031325 RepID=A0ABT5XZ65_9FLAO|nr:hypothetical protein [[Muricauda] yonaguniensis]MDF0716425.1 hypothetical protein [[Muricauda] yonaguniensis]